MNRAGPIAKNSRFLHFPGAFLPRRCTSSNRDSQILAPGSLQVGFLGWVQPLPRPQSRGFRVLIRNRSSALGRRTAPRAEGRFFLLSYKEEFCMASLEERKWTKRFLIAGSLLTALVAVPLVYATVEAPAGFDNLTNGFESQAQMDLDRAVFEERETIADGLGPVYNAQSCTECHQNPVTGATSQVTELRVGRFDGYTFTDRPGGSLINDRAINAAIQERAAGADNVATFRTSLNTLGDGFVEALP